MFHVIVDIYFHVGLVVGDRGTGARPTFYPCPDNPEHLMQHTRSTRLATSLGKLTPSTDRAQTQGAQRALPPTRKYRRSLCYPCFNGLTATRLLAEPFPIADNATDR